MSQPGPEDVLVEAARRLAAGERWEARKLVVEAARNSKDRAPLLAFLEAHFPLAKDAQARLARLSDPAASIDARLECTREVDAFHDPRFLAPLERLRGELAAAQERFPVAGTALYHRMLPLWPPAPLHDESVESDDEDDDDAADEVVIPELGDTWKVVGEIGVDSGMAGAVPLDGGERLKTPTGIGDGVWPVEACRGEKPGSVQIRVVFDKALAVGREWSRGVARSRSGFFAVVDPIVDDAPGERTAAKALAEASLAVVDGTVVVRATSAALWIRGKRDAPGIMRITFGLRSEGDPEPGTSA